jgi:DNA repair protein RadC
MRAKQYELPLSEPASQEETGNPTTAPKTPSPRALRVEEQGIINRAFEILRARHAPGQPLSSPEQTREFLRLKIGEELNEVFGCIFLDNRHRVIAIENLFFGTIDGASVHPRVIVQKALGHNAAAILAYHNHPSGVAEPSQSDVRLTRQLQEALKLVDVRVLDHIVVCVGECTSLAERGLI